MAITRGALRIRDRKTTRSTRHIQDKTSMPKTSPLTQDSANKDMAITRSALRSRDDRTRSTRHLQNKTSMPKTSPRSKDRASKGIPITRGALRIRDRKKTGPPRQHVIQDTSSMPKASPLAQDRANKDISITGGALNTKDHKRRRSKRQHFLQDKTSMSKASPLSKDKASKDIAIARSARRTRGVRPPSSPSPSNMPVTKLARMRPPSSPSPSNMPATKRARMRPPSSPSPSNMPAIKLSHVRPSSSPSPSNMPATKLSRVRPPSSPSPSNMPATKRARMRPPSSPSPSNMTATKLGDSFVMSIIDTNRCRITGSAAMNDNRLIIVDDSNNKVKLINTNTNRLMFSLNVYTRPWDVSAISKHQAVVTLPDSKKILVVKVTDTIVKEREISVCGLCNGVAYSRDRLLLANSSNPRLEILDLHGTVIMTVDYDTDGNNLFKLPLYMCVSEDGETVYVSDWARHTVTSLTLDGVVKAVYKDDELKYPGKVCTDHHGNVYVCDVWNSNVHMLTADCRKVKVILTQADGLDSGVWSVSHCQDTNRLFIGMESNTIQSYQLA